MDELIVLGSDSHTLDGCDRVALLGDQVIVQGKPEAVSYPAGSPLRVPSGRDAERDLGGCVPRGRPRTGAQAGGMLVSAPGLLELYRRAAGEAFRLECPRQEYAVPAESVQFRAFREGARCPSIPPSNSPCRSSARRWRGARALCGHTLWTSRSACTCGMRWPLTRRTLPPGSMSASLPGRGTGTSRACAMDFVLFDAEGAVVFMDYDADGRLTGTRYTDDPGGRRPRPQDP